jgi:hypothetical protein
MEKVEKKDTNKKKRVGGGGGGGGKDVDGHGDSDVLWLKCSDSANTPSHSVHTHRHSVTAVSAKTLQ